MNLKETLAGVILDLDETLPITPDPFIHEPITQINCLHHCDEPLRGEP